MVSMNDLVIIRTQSIRTTCELIMKTLENVSFKKHGIFHMNFRTSTKIKNKYVVLPTKNEPSKGPCNGSFLVVKFSRKALANHSRVQFRVFNNS